MLKASCKPQTVYNALCSHHEPTPEPTGKVRNRNTFKKGTREALRKQLQWEVTWSPIAMQKWELDLAHQHLGYTIESQRLATPADFCEEDNFCEYCMKGPQAATVYECSQCQRGYHEHCIPRKARNGASTLDNDEDWLCPECTQNQWGGAFRQGYLEEGILDSQTMTENGHGDLVQQTALHAREAGADMHQPQPRAARDAHMSNKDRQGNSGPRQHTTLGEGIRKKLRFETTPVDPHADIEGTGTCEITIRTIHRRHKLPGGAKKNYVREMACVHNAAGHTVGMLSVSRMARLWVAYNSTLQHRPQLVDSLKPGRFEEEVAALLGRYKEGGKVPGSKRTVTLTNHWATPTAVYRMLQEHIPGLCKERFASPLNCHVGMTQYWSCFERDQLFGASYNAYSCQWEGISVANPEYDSKEMYKAVSWGVHSAKIASEPTLTLFVLPAWAEGSNTAYLKWLRKEPEICRHVMTVPRKSFKFMPPQMETLGLSPTDADTPKWDVNFVLVGNAAGYARAFPNSIEASLQSIRHDMITVVNSDVQPAVPLSDRRLRMAWQINQPGPVISTDEAPADQAGEPAEGADPGSDPVLYKPPDKVQQAPPEASLTHAALPAFTPEMEGQFREELAGSRPHRALKYDWKGYVYTDGSGAKAAHEEGPGIGAGIYVPSSTGDLEAGIRIGVDACDEHGPNNTAYRAELVGILAALTQGHGCIMTDCLNAIHSVRNAVMDPESLTYHRHAHLLRMIVEAASAHPTRVTLIKLKGHSGIPGNEYADDIAGLVADGTEPPDLVLEGIQSNNRDQQYWPKQQEWREDDSTESGYKEHWWTLPNLDASLTQAVHEPMHMGQADTKTDYYKYMQAALPHIAADCAGTWQTMVGVTSGMKSIRAQYLTGQLLTAKNLFRYGKVKSARCPLCKACTDSGHHAVSGCKHMQKAVQERHNGLVRIIAKAVAAGDMGADMIAYTDGGAWEKWDELGAASQHRTLQDIPEELLTQEQVKDCHSRPDMLLYRPASTGPMPNSEEGQRAAAKIILVEVKYTRDTDTSQQLTDAMAQHETMCTKLRENHPTARVEQVVILMGVAGTVYQEYTKAALYKLGVRRSHRDSTIRKMQLHSLTQLQDIWKKRQAAMRQAKHAHHAQDTAQDAPNRGEGPASALHGDLGGGRGGSTPPRRGGRPAPTRGPSTTATAPMAAAAANGGTQNHQRGQKRRRLVRGGGDRGSADPAASRPAAAAVPQAGAAGGKRRPRDCPEPPNRGGKKSRNGDGQPGEGHRPQQRASTASKCPQQAQDSRQQRKRSAHHQAGGGGQERPKASKKKQRLSASGTTGRCPARHPHRGGGTMHPPSVNFSMGRQGGKTGVG
jgi:ribonuclease HI